MTTTLRVKWDLARIGLTILTPQAAFLDVPDDAARQYGEHFLQRWSCGGISVPVSSVLNSLGLAHQAI